MKKYKFTDKNEEIHAFRPNEHSIKLFKTRKLTKLKGIFELLDSDNDGFISKNSMEIDNLPEIAYEILKPVLIELEESGEKWDFEGFIEEAGKLMKKLTVTEKSSIMGSNQKKTRNFDEEFMFQVNS